MLSRKRGWVEMEGEVADESCRREEEQELEAGQASGGRVQ